MPCQPHRTASTRKQASLPARGAFYNKLIRKGHRILDYGCGRGSDVVWLCRMGMDAVGYDPHEPFGYGVLPEGQFDGVLCTYVVNTLSTRGARLVALRYAWGFVAPGGYLLVAARCAKDVQEAADRRSWPVHNDGYWSNETQGMFQKGHTQEDLLQLARDMQTLFEPAGEMSDPKPYVGDKGYVSVLLWKSTTPSGGPGSAAL